jgi:two-component system sensor histidine kinase BaeS
MRGNERTRRIPLIFVTAGTADTQRRFRGYEAGAVDFIYKPIEADILRSKADVFFELYRQRQQIAAQRDALKLQSEALQETDRRKDILAADIAHELRNPLSALQAGLEELRDGLEPASPQRLGGLHDQALRLSRIVGDLSELSAAESSALSLRRRDTDLTALTRSVLAAREPQLRAAGLDVRADLPGSLVVPADADRIHQVLGNLLANAARYCRPGDAVTVRLSRDGRDAVIEVADTGPGIPGADLPHVFDRLWRGRGARGVAGHGIGLAVVREIVTAHGGTVSARSDPGGGAAFTIRLPAGTGAGP